MLINICKVVYCAINRERQSLGKTNKKLDKRLKELTLQYDEERRSANQYKEQVSGVQCYL